MLLFISSSLIIIILLALPHRSISAQWHVQAVNEAALMLLISQHRSIKAQGLFSGSRGREGGAVGNHQRDHQHSPTLVIPSGQWWWMGRSKKWWCSQKLVVTLWWTNITLERSTMLLMGKSTISTAPFSIAMLVHQRVMFIVPMCYGITFLLVYK